MTDLLRAEVEVGGRHGADPPLRLARERLLLVLRGGRHQDLLPTVSVVWCGVCVRHEAASVRVGVGVSPPIDDARTHARLHAKRQIPSDAPVDVLGAGGERGELRLLPRLLLDLRHLFFGGVGVVDIRVREMRG